MKTRANLLSILLLALLGAALLISPACALKVYIVPSVQVSNHSPDHTYVEGDAMVDVASRVVTKFSARGITAKSSGYDFGNTVDAIKAACADAAAWGADVCVSNHTNASAGNDTGWHTAHGSESIYLTDFNGYSDPNDVDLSGHCLTKCVEKFGAFGRGYNWGGNYGSNQGDFIWNAPGDHCLVEGLYHDNYDDLQVLNSSAGKDAYAEAIFEAILDHYGLPYTSTRVPFMVKNQDGRLQAFLRGRVDTKLYTCWQTAVNATTWTSWTAIGSSNYAGNPSAVLDSTGIITVAIRATDGSISNLWQTAANAYGSWSVGGWGGNVAGDAKIVLNQNGNRQVFVRGGNNVLYTNYENPRTSWSGWVAIGVGSYAGDPSVILDNTGILTIAIRHTDGSIRSLWQTAANGYASWGTGTWDGNVPGEPVLALNQNGMRQMFVRGGSGYMHTRYENPRGTWSGWNTINQLTTYAGNPAVVLDQSGRLDVFCRMTNNSEGVYWETNPNSYTTWSSGGLDGVISYDPAVAKCANGLRQTIVIDSVGTMFLRCETSAGVWGGWNSMAGSP